MLRWARERAGLSGEALARRIPQLSAWEQGATQPTLKQIERFARVTHTPVGFLFLPEPPVEIVPIPDFRTMTNERVGRPSADLLDTIYICQQRQEWYRDFAHAEGAPRLGFVGSASVTSDVTETAARMRATLNVDLQARQRSPTWTDALRQLVGQADATGILVMISGVVGSNNRRTLNPKEFRGFALSDDVAPLVFMNGADTKAAQMFTLVHELAHLWLGQSALSDVGPVSAPTNRVERWCNQVAAEFLVPLNALRAEYRTGTALQDESGRLARVFKVSSLVILRRLYDIGVLQRDEMWRAYEAELERLLAVARSSGGDFYLTQAARVGRRFARALVTSTLEGQTLYRDAFHLLGFSKLETFRELGRSLGAA